ncbi:phosphonate metabolism protein/1,5-bisphosphokinase (PRPP-forming) PhnN [Devosia sp.]|uniref:phosphonate metabolism protein/1,5-bisphosphokinase (PRPP-forming) PhnN n=1 Tax=Devosia sp. TaxID=1871048 RepID=UPI0032669FF2
MNQPAGTLVLVVGPSGVGKDTLINGARAALAADPRFVFVRRIVTRQADAALEDHDTLDLAAFAALEAAGGLALSWQAHGLCYGLPASVRAQIERGLVVIANGSRQTLTQARDRFPTCQVLLITADMSLRAARLAQRGREDAEAVAARLARETAPLPAGINPVVIDNSGTPAQGIAELVEALQSIARH